MVFQVPGLFGRKTTPDLTFLVARSRELEREISGAETHLTNLRADLLKIEVIAAEAGLAKQLAKALAPPPPRPVISYTRIRALKAYKVLYRGPRGAEWYSGGPGRVIDLPSELVAQLKTRVEPVPPDTELHGVPLQDWMRTDD